MFLLAEIILICKRLVTTEKRYNVLCTLKNTVWSTLGLDVLVVAILMFWLEKHVF